MATVNLTGDKSPLYVLAKGETIHSEAMQLIIPQQGG
jgi:hypothetical protein